MSIRNYSFTLLKQLLICVVIFGIFIAIGVAFLQMLQGPPFVMKVQPSGDGAVVQFVKPSRDAENEAFVSPEFKVDLPVSQPFEIVLSREKVKIPGGTITFRDTSMLPGRFTIEYGGVEFDVMSSRIDVDNITHFWTPQERGSK